MRKITENILHAICNPGMPGTRRTFGNTTVDYYSENNIAVYLHGSRIAQVDPRTVYLSLAGWDTPTTRSRLDAIAFAFARYHVSRVKGETRAWPTAMAKGATPGPVDMAEWGWIALPRWDV